MEIMKHINAWKKLYIKNIKIRTEYQLNVFIPGIILSHEEEQLNSDNTTTQLDRTKTSIELGSPPYTKSNSPPIMHDEELPPYSVLAPKSRIKRRKREDFSQEEPLELKSIDKDIKEMTDDKNCPIRNMGDCIWLQNVSQVPVFVTSPTLEPFPQVPDNSKLRASSASSTSQTDRFDDEYKNIKTSLNGKDTKTHFQLVYITLFY